MSGFKKAKIGLVQFLGSNCDQDCIDAFSKHFGIDLVPIWHRSENLGDIDGLVLPGGFSYGDFLRSGALASHTKIMGAVKEFAHKGGAILGICNGFQILVESQILPGALLKNDVGHFVCSYVDLELAQGKTGYHRLLGKAQAGFQIPIAHGEGRYFAPPEILKQLEAEGQILFRYKGQNPNGSLNNIAGVLSANGRILGMMPHPERATDRLIGGSADGLHILSAFLESCF